ncbi:hypothetical protein B0I37DRAFT_190075 [Chaetomium sp. MPI-CAGE-AT-0009]|nr:hypothetical protein B0I37DRAFT_190075 [Chaetomium sp. MPI-CAGE-AT-0009]
MWKHAAVLQPRRTPDNLRFELQPKSHTPTPVSQPYLPTHVLQQRRDPNSNRNHLPKTPPLRIHHIQPNRSREHLDLHPHPGHKHHCGQPKRRPLPRQQQQQQQQHPPLKTRSRALLQRRVPPRTHPRPHYRQQEQHHQHQRRPPPDQRRQHPQRGMRRDALNELPRVGVDDGTHRQPGVLPALGDRRDVEAVAFVYVAARHAGGELEVGVEDPVDDRGEEVDDGGEEGDGRRGGAVVD